MPRLTHPSFLSLFLPGYQEVDIFTEIRGGQPDFDAVFGGQHGQTQPKPLLAMGNGLGGMLEPMAVGAHAAQQTTFPPEAQPTGLSGIDVESSLTKAAENLSELLRAVELVSLSLSLSGAWVVCQRSSLMRVLSCVHEKAKNGDLPSILTVGCVRDGTENRSCMRALPDVL